jgi:DNA-binding NtrC family response regulator
VAETQIDNITLDRQLVGAKRPAVARNDPAAPAASAPVLSAVERIEGNVLIVGDDTETIRCVLETLARRGSRGIVAGDEKTALDFLDKADCRLVFTADRISRRPGSPTQPAGGLDLLRKIKANSPELPVIMLTKDACDKTADPATARHFAATSTKLLIETAVKAIQAGCRDFLTCPLDRQKVTELLDTYLPAHSGSTVAFAEHDIRTLYRIVGKSQRLIQTVNIAKKIAPTSAPVLISGDSGTGKELISCLIHYASRRADGPYVKVNCAALTETLLESELFGHEKGAFTGAYAQRKGHFEMAHGGTLLLDEITETPLRFQAKLLRVIEQQDFQRVGGNENVRVDVRIISTTNKNLLREVAEGSFRQDLYYRLSAVRLVVAPLRERTEDLPDLVWHFVNLYSHQAQRRITRLDPAMMDVFAKYHWPGNVRQLRNVVLTSLILGAGETLSLTDVSWLFDELQPLPEPAKTALDPENIDYNLAGFALDQIERRAILDTLRQTNGNQTKAAKVLGISDRTLRDKMRRYREQTCPQPVS